MNIGLATWNEIVEFDKLCSLTINFLWFQEDKEDLEELLDDEADCLFSRKNF